MNILQSLVQAELHTVDLYECPISVVNSRAT